MKHPHDTHLLPLGVLAGAVLLAGCQNALIYGEGTNVSLATIKLNDDVSEPVSVNFGLDRTIATVAPPKDENGESVNMISAFGLKQEGDGGFGKLKISTQFASGAAGKTLASTNPGAAASIMGVTPDGAALTQRKANAVAYVDGLADVDKLAAIATAMGVKGNSTLDKDSIRDALVTADKASFSGYSKNIYSVTGVNF